MPHNGGMDEFSFFAAQAAELGRPVPPVRRREHALADGRTLSALQYGDAATGEFPPPAVTFVHGAGLNAHTWDTTVLAMGLPALSIDLPGHGDSSWRDDADYGGRTLAADIAAPLAQWTDAPQVLVGQSLGGLAAAAVAASHPALVRALVIVDITPGIDPNGDAAQIAAFFAGPTDWASREELVERALAFGLGGSRAAATRGVFLNSRVRADGRIEWKHHFARLANARATPGSDIVQNPLRPTAAASGWADLAAVIAPITLVRGDRGFVTPADAAQFRAHVPSAAIAEVSSGHNVHEEQPLALAALVADIAADREPSTDDRG